MKIIIAGAGAVGTHLAKLLSREKQDIILMDDNEERLSTLSSNFDLMTVTASPTSIQGLKEVQIGRYIFAVCQYAFLPHALHYRYNISFA